MLSRYLFGHGGKRLDKKAKASFIFYWETNDYNADITSRSKGIQSNKVGQLIEDNVKNTFFQKSYKKMRHRD